MERGLRKFSYVRRGRRLALDLHPCRHSRRRLGDCFPQALTTSVKRKRGLRKGTPLALLAVNDLLTTASDGKRYAEVEINEAATCSKMEQVRQEGEWQPNVCLRR